MKNPINTLSVMIALAFGNTALAEKPYSSTSVIQINPSQIVIPPNSDGFEGLFTADDMEKELKAVTSSEVLNAALKSMDPNDEVDERALAEVRKKITLNPRRGTDFVEITVEDSDPTKATNLANSIADTFIKQHNYNQSKEDYEQSQVMFREMKIKQQEARVLLKMPRTPATLHERAK